MLPTSVIFRSVFANFRKFCPFLERMKTDGATPEILPVRCVLYVYVLCPSASGTGPSTISPTRRAGSSLGGKHSRGLTFQGQCWHNEQKLLEGGGGGRKVLVAHKQKKLNKYNTSKSQKKSHMHKHHKYGQINKIPLKLTLSHKPPK